MARRIGLVWCVLLMVTGCGSGSATIVHDGGELQGQNFWESGTHVVNGDIHIENGTLTIDAGAKVLMASGVNILVTSGGSLSINGTAGNPVHVQPQDGAGPWGAIAIDSTADTTSAIVYTYLSGGGAVDGMVQLVGDELGAAQLTLTSSTLANSVSYGLEMSGPIVLNEFNGNTFSANASGPVACEADDVAMLYGTGNAFDNVISVVSSTLHADAAWLDLGQPYLIDALEIASGSGSQSALLTVGPNVTLMMSSGGSITIYQDNVTGNGGINFVGTAQEPIMVTSSRAQPKAGDWASIVFAGAKGPGEATQIGSYIEHTTLAFGGGNDANGVAQSGALQVAQYGSVNLDEVTIRASAADGLDVVPGGYAYAVANSNIVLVDNLGVAIDTDPDGLGYLMPAYITISGENNVVLVEEGTLSQNANWYPLVDPDSRIIINGNLTAATASGSTAPTLNIEAGTSLYLESGVALAFNDGAQLNLNGTQAAPVTITAYDSTKSWDVIILTGDNTFNYADISYGGGNGDVGQIQVQSGYLQMYNTTFSGSTAAYNPKAGMNCDYKAASANLGAANTDNGTQC